MKKALITGITGQDGSYLAELLLSKKYQVIGLVSNKFNIGYDNIDHIKNDLILEEGDLLDKASLENIFAKHKPNEIYNLAGLTFVPKSWDDPTLTININTLGVSRLLEIISNSYRKTRLYQASSSKMFGLPKHSPQTENTPLNPLDPYSISKTTAHQLVQIFRDHFEIYAVSGILFNHESERRGPEFVTRKITQAAVNIKLGLLKELTLGDLDAKQDWGYAPDYVEAMWLMLQQDKPDDYVIASGEYHSVRDIVEIAFKHLGLEYKKYVKTDKKLYRKEQLGVPQGDYSKAKEKMGWQPKTSFYQMIVNMVEHDLKLASQK